MQTMMEQGDAQTEYMVNQIDLWINRNVEDCKDCRRGMEPPMGSAEGDTSVWIQGI